MSFFERGCLVLGLMTWVSAAAAEPPRQLTRDGRQCFDPVFVQGGKEIVFTVLASPTQTSLLRLRLPGGAVEPLHSDAITSEFEAAFSADGRYYAFVQSRGNLNLKLIIRDTKLSKDAVFDPGGGFAGMRRPSFVGSPGTELEFAL